LKAIEVLLSHGVKEERIIFLNLVSVLRERDMFKGLTVRSPRLKVSRASVANSRGFVW
jgi:hypothetical protein